jgi:uncharacterized protein with FMN-binding domain
MNKSSLSWLAATLAMFGAAVTSGHPAWGTVTGVAILLLAGAIAAGAIAAGAVPARSEDYIIDRNVGRQRISNSLVSLSSAAILAVYAAGYHRTGSAADEFDAQAARRKTAAPMAATVVAPRTANPEAEAPPVVPGSPAPPLRKGHPRSSSTGVPKTARVPTERSQATQVAPPMAITTPDPVAEPIAQPTVTSQIPYNDGTYLGWGTSRHGNIQASVVIRGGQIISTAIAVCATRYSCSWIAALPGQVVSRQSAYVDYVSGATESSDAFSYAVAAALSKARE